MQPFRDWSIRHKLIGLLLSMALCTALMVALPMGIFDFLGLKHAIARDQAVLADTLARNSTAALAFRDLKAAQDTLQALRAEPSVTAACIYDSDGKPLAKYLRDGNPSDFVPPPAQDSLTRFEPKRLLQFRDIYLDGDAIGTIYIESDLKRLDTRLREYTMAFLATLLVTLVLSYFIASRLQRPISLPLRDLVSTAAAISGAQNYSIRAQSRSHDEFGLLVTSFNGMLDQIENNREQLEKQVAERTSELVFANAQLRRAEEKYRAIFEDAVIGIFQATPDGRPLRINRALAELHGYDSPDQLMSEVSNVVTDFFVQPSRMNELMSELKEKGFVRHVELEFYRKDRTKKWVMANIRSVRDASGAITLLEGTMEDITDRKRAEEQVQFLAFYDALTGLPNRTLLGDRLANALASARRRSEKVAVLFLDLDRFKIINDSLGHSCGDLLLQEVAIRLKKSAREHDTVARLGGDEFVIVMAGIKDVADAAVGAERIMDNICTEFVIQGHSLTVSCSIVISIYPDHGTDSETLVKHADAAMYCAKENGRNAFRLFSEDMNEKVVERLTIEHNLRSALDKDELFLVYQPQTELATGAIIGVEALLRWKHPELGLVPPDHFIRVAENTGLILPIGEWVLRTACTTARRWQDTGLPPVPVAVNVSAVQFRQEGFRALVQRILHETRLAPEYLELELTESVLLSNADLTFPVLQDLKSMGVQLAIDDFGTGYSSLSYLRQFPVHRLKIDRSFIKAVAVNSDDAAITSAIISMGRNLNLKVIAEGVEDEAQIAFLKQHHCDEIQGYYFSRPLTVEQIDEKLRSVKKAVSALGQSAGH
jgi:diguanylate cyclase (GGDEF)-like protein/PAS domain S-box-containing protein